VVSVQYHRDFCLLGDGSKINAIVYVGQTFDAPPAQLAIKVHHHALSWRQINIVSTRIFNALTGARFDWS